MKGEDRNRNLKGNERFLKWASCQGSNLMFDDEYQDRGNAPIECPLKKSEIAWGRCEQYRRKYKCLCKETRDRLRLKGDGKEVFEEKLRQIRQPIPEKPPGWTVERMTRFYVIVDENGERVHRTTNQDECEHYLQLAARVKVLERETEQLWKLLEEELIDRDDPWEKVDEFLQEDEYDDEEDYEYE